jgi:hypothetical protein
VNAFSQVNYPLSPAMVPQPGNFKNQYLGNGAKSESAIFTPGSGHRDLLIHVTFKSIANI